MTLLDYLLQCCHKGLVFVCFFTLETALLYVSKLLYMALSHQLGMEVMSVLCSWWVPLLAG